MVSFSISPSQSIDAADYLRTSKFQRINNIGVECPSSLIDEAIYQSINMTFLQLEVTLNDGKVSRHCCCLYE